MVAHYFLLGLVCGAAIMLAATMSLWHSPRFRAEYDRQRTARENKPFRLPWQAPKKVEPPKDYPVAPIRRTVGSWRQQKANLEREHNSKQKERDQRVAGL